MSYKPLQYFSYLFVINTMMSVGPWMRFPIGDSTVFIFVVFMMLGIVIWFGKKTKSFADPELRLCNAYLLWLIICIIRGFFVAENYWEYRQLLLGSLSLLMPLFVFYFKEPLCLLIALQKWNVWLTPLFFFFFIWMISSDAYHFLLTPFLLYGCFFNFLSKKWKIIGSIGNFY